MVDQAVEDRVGEGGLLRYARLANRRCAGNDAGEGADRQEKI